MEIKINGKHKKLFWFEICLVTGSNNMKSKQTMAVKLWHVWKYVQKIPSVFLELRQEGEKEECEK